MTVGSEQSRLGRDRLGRGGLGRDWLGRDWLTVLALLVLAAMLRLPNLETRGTWDADQGHDMLVLREFVTSGTIPLLGPPTSIGDFHHGAVYYYLLSPAAWLTGGDSPLAVVFLIALAGIAAVGVTWWLARSIGGRGAGFVAGLLMAVSAAAIDESTFIWNPNIIALSSSVALAGAWQAWRTGRLRWWLVAAVGSAVTMQGHVLGAMLLPIVGALLVADLRRRPVAARRGVALAGVTALAIIALSYVPLVVHELTTDFAEVRAALDYYLGGGREPSPFNPIVRALIIGLRVVTWPLVGLITDAGTVAIVTAGIVLVLVAWRWRRGVADERTAIRWLGLGLAWTTVSLSLVAASLATVTPGLPNDHYHAFADPMVFTLVGLGVAALWRWRPRDEREAPGAVRFEVRPALRPDLGTRSGPAGAVLLVAALIGWNLLHWPPSHHPDGGFPAARVAAARVGDAVGDRPTTLRSIPDFKSTEAYAYPLELEGTSLVGVNQASALVVICDDLFVEVTGAPCGGPAEDAEVGTSNRFVELADRFAAAPGRWISVYLTAE